MKSVVGMTLLLCFSSQISPATLDAFLMQVEKGYKSHQNPYHNETHGADVLQTVHALVHSAKLEHVRVYVYTTFLSCMLFYVKI